MLLEVKTKFYNTLKFVQNIYITKKWNCIKLYIFSR